MTATASSGLPVSFSALGACAVSANTVTLTGSGSCTVTASQGGDALYIAAASVPRTFNIAASGPISTPTATASLVYVGAVLTGYQGGW